MSKKYLISIAIGPVQDFIASARRSRDLWFGSHLLSELSKVVAREIGKENLVFPAISDDSQLEENSEFNVVNKILAIAEISDKDKFDENLRDKIKDRLERIYKDNGTNKGIFDEIDRKLDKDKSFFYRTEAEAQIKDLTEFYWAAVPYEADKYDECRNRVELLLNARKATRNFKQITWGSNAPKSSLDGQRESVIEDDLIKNDEVKAQKIFGLRKKERLCGVGILKRLAEKGTDDRFFSTSHVASLPLILSLENNDKNKELVENYVREIARLINENENLHRYVGKVPDGLESEVFGKYDGHLLFENRLKDFPFENGNLDKAKKALKTFMLKAFGKEDKKPNPYFALLQVDGDRMGTVIDNQDTPEKHKKLSKALRGFAGDVKDIVEKHSGCLIYAGGDDVLAMLPLHTVLDCTRKLANKFREDLKSFDFIDEKTNEEIKPTLSAGIAIVHHTEPLQESLEAMRNAEKEAKKVKGKNALAIILSKRSGADTTIKGSWANDSETDKSFDQRLKWFIYLHLAELLPSGVAHELRDLWLRFRDENSSQGKIKTGFDEIVRKEAFRIIKRKKTPDGRRNISDEIFDELKDFVEISDLSVESLAKEIIVAKEFYKAYKQAGVTAQEFAERNGFQKGENENDG